MKKMIAIITLICTLVLVGCTLAVDTAKEEEPEKIIFCYIAPEDQP